MIETQFRLFTGPIDIDTIITLAVCFDAYGMDLILQQGGKLISEVIEAREYPWYTEKQIEDRDYDPEQIKVSYNILKGLMTFSFFDSTDPIPEVIFNYTEIPPEGIPIETKAIKFSGGGSRLKFYREIGSRLSPTYLDSLLHNLNVELKPEAYASYATELNKYLVKGELGKHTKEIKDIVAKGIKPYNTKGAVLLHAYGEMDKETKQRPVTTSSYGLSEILRKTIDYMNDFKSY